MIGETLAGRYRVERLLGRGGMSAVWLALDLELPREVAIKLLHARRLESADAVERFEREARTLAGLAHPGIVTVIDRGEHDGRPFIVFEHVRGQDLRARIAARGRLPAAEALAVCSQVADALAYAHRQGVIHRDVKPHNVLLTEDGHAKLTDFGIARILQEPSLTATGRVLGTGEYIAPEQAAGQPLDERADVYALGVMLYHCLTGEPPYSGDGFVELAEQHLRAPVPSAAAVQPGVPAEVDQALQHALAKDPADRFPDCEAFRDELERLLQQELHTAAPQTAKLPVVAQALADDEPTPTHGMPAPLATPGRSRRPSIVGVLAVAVLIAGGAAAFLLARSTGDDHPAAAATTTGATRSTPAPPSTASVGRTQRRALATLAVSGTSTFDPMGDGTENPSTAHSAVDGSPATSWSTEGYKASANLNGTKPGVGLVLALTRTDDVTRLRLQTPQAGWTGRIYTSPADSSPSSLAGWKPASQVFTMHALRQSVALHAGRARLLLIWITNLTGSPGNWRAQIAEATPLGPHQ